ncbi:MAG: ATP-binding cassette domain-containing protein [Thermaerobacter sp.]|nr:ATP-binding cassette domain-containing protein [Thermaerobacter sp.]
MSPWVDTLDEGKTDTVVKFQDVSVRRDRMWLVQNICWTVRKGENWAIVGPNGAGKSTLLNVLQGYEWPTRGGVQVLGKVMGRADWREVRARLGWVGQGLGDWMSRYHAGDPAGLVVATGAMGQIGSRTRAIPVAIETKAQATLAGLGLDYLHNRPFGRLSQGERQRVLVARAWMADPGVIVFDEVTAGLDLAGRQQVFESLAALTKNRRNAPSLLYITHHVEEIGPWFSHVLVLREGGVVAQGTREQTLSDAVLSAAFGVHVQLTWQDGRPWARVSSAGGQSMP